jgi:hypothetical protein
LEDIDIEFGVGIFVDIDKERALRVPDNPNSVQYGRISRSQLNKMANKKDLFHLCAAAAAALDVDYATVELDVPISGFDKVKPWIPSLDVGVKGDPARQAVQV